MTNGNRKSASSRWDVGFFIKGVAPGRRLGSDYLRMGTTIAQDGPQIVEVLGKQSPLMAEFSRSPGKWGVLLVAVRVNAEGETEAVHAAWRLLSHVIDGYALVLDEIPKVSPVLLLRQGDEKDALIRAFSDKAWVTLNAKDPAVTKSWDARCSEVLERLIPFYEKVLDNISEKHSALENQLMYSLRLFRLGVQTQTYGIEFICKFMAIEGLVMGGEKPKWPELGNRLSRLLKFASWDVKAKVEELWEKRHLIAHEARSEYFEDDDQNRPTGTTHESLDFIGFSRVGLPKSRLTPSHRVRGGRFSKENRVFSHISCGTLLDDDNSFPYQILIPRLDEIAAVVCVFAADNITNAKTITELWALVDHYVPPDFLKQGRPDEMRRLGGISLMNHGTFTGVGALFDRIFEAELKKDTTTSIAAGRDVSTSSA